MHALIDESRCIGCTKCISACGHDAIVGARKMVHTVLENACTACGDCLPVCPVDCITWSGDIRESDTPPPPSFQRKLEPLDRALAQSREHAPTSATTQSTPLPQDLLIQIARAREAAQTKFTIKKGPLNTPKALRRKQAK